MCHRRPYLGFYGNLFSDFLKIINLKKKIRRQVFCDLSPQNLPEGYRRKPLIVQESVLCILYSLIRIKYDNIEKSMEAICYSEKSVHASHTV